MITAEYHGKYMMADISRQILQQIFYGRYITAEVSQQIYDGRYDGTTKVAISETMYGARSSGSMHPILLLHTSF